MPRPEEVRARSAHALSKDSHKVLFHHDTVRTGSVKCASSGPRIGRCHARGDGYNSRYETSSRGGNLAAAMAIDRILRRERAHLIIDDSGVCVSV